MSETAIVLSTTDPDLPREVPRGLARYVSRHPMAAGGAGVLQSAVDPIIGRSVAIKLLPPAKWFDREARRRLLREARVTAQLQHPNTVPVYDIGDDPSEGVYFVMKRISGENLFSVLRRIARGDEAAKAAYPIARRLEIVADCCQALAYAHVRGVIHRDVKPENIWVGNFGEVILLDWGVAKVWGSMDDNPPIRPEESPDDGSSHEPLSEEPASLATLTAGGQRPGTPLYMSPEQVRGNRSLDERSDIFNVGVVLYESMALHEPFRGGTIDETFDNICRREVRPPTQLRPDWGIPPGADVIVARCLAKKPADRYSSMREVIAAIRDLT